jgi:hypothetical protein
MDRQIHARMEAEMRHPRLLAGAAAILLIAGCSDSTAPLFTPDQALSLDVAATSSECVSTPFRGVFGTGHQTPAIPLAPGFRGWVPSSPVPHHVYHVMGEADLALQDGDANEHRGVAYLTRDKNTWTIQLRMTLKGHKDVLTLYGTARDRGGIISLDQDFVVNPNYSKPGIYDHNHLKGPNEKLRVVGTIYLPGTGAETASWLIDDHVTTCGSPTPGPNPWFTVLECEGLTCGFFNTDMPGRDSRGNPVTFLWDFDSEGESPALSVLQNPTHTYPASGTYTVRMTVTMTGTDGVAYTAALDDDYHKQPLPTVTVTAVGDGDPAVIDLTATLRMAGRNAFVDLVWSGATASSVDIWRNEEKIATASNSGSYSDRLRTPGTYAYKVCQADTSICSNPAEVTY